MARNSASPLRRRLSLISAVGVWLAVVALTQGAPCAELGDALQRMEDRIELRLRPAPTPTLREAPSRSSEPEPIEPWELVGV
jgi:hypothetical protein